MRTFHLLLANTLVANVTNNFLWFALTFRRDAGARAARGRGLSRSVELPMVGEVGASPTVRGDRSREGAPGQSS